MHRNNYKSPFLHCIKCRCSALFTLFLLVTVLVLSSSSNVYATETATNYNLSGTNKSTGYEYILDDSANFIDDAVNGRLISQMKKTTEYCNIAVVTTTSHPYGSTESMQSIPLKAILEMAQTVSFS